MTRRTVNLTAAEAYAISGAIAKIAGVPAIERTSVHRGDLDYLTAALRDNGARTLDSEQAEDAVAIAGEYVPVLDRAAAATLEVGATFRVVGTLTVWTVEGIRPLPDQARRLYTVVSDGGFRQALPLHDDEAVELIPAGAIA